MTISCRPEMAPRVKANVPWFPSTLRATNKTSVSPGITSSLQFSKINSTGCPQKKLLRNGSRNQSHGICQLEGEGGPLCFHFPVSIPFPCPNFDNGNIPSRSETPKSHSQCEVPNLGLGPNWDQSPEMVPYKSQFCSQVPNFILVARCQAKSNISLINSTVNNNKKHVIFDLIVFVIVCFLSQRKCPYMNAFAECLLLKSVI